MNLILLTPLSAALALALLLPAPARAECQPLRVGYIDQHRPPYWLGAGTAVPQRPGASVELIQRMAASVGCGTQLKRLPLLRTLPALAAGDIDFAPMDPSAAGTPGIVFPTDKEQRIDTARAVPTYIVVFARASDRLPADVDTGAYYQNPQHLLGMTLGAAYAPRLKKAGFNIDAGAVDAARNFEKLRLHRIDGFAISLTLPDDMDNYVKEKYGSAIVRLQRPLLADHAWLAVNQAYYDAHKAQVEAMWNWLGGSGNKEFAALLASYAGKR